MDYAYNYTARIDRELLEIYHEGLICSPPNGVKPVTSIFI